MAKIRRRDHHRLNPRVREELLDRLRNWLAEADDSEKLALARRDIETVESVLVEALRDLPILQRKLDALLWQDTEAKKAIRDGKGKERVYQACRIKGFLPQDGKKTPKKYPPHDRLLLELQYVALTQQDGQVTLDDEMAHYDITAPGPTSDATLHIVGENFLVTVDGCPREPWDVVQELADFYGSSSTAMLRELWRRHRRIELRRDQLLRAGDVSAAMALPRLDSLPQMREVE